MQWKGPLVYGTAHRLGKQKLSYARNEIMPILQLRETVFDKLMILWSLCLISHYSEIGRKLSKHNIVAEFNEYTWELWESACAIAEQRKLLDSNMQLTPKGQVACDNWKLISDRLFAV